MGTGPSHFLRLGFGLDVGGQFLRDFLANKKGLIHFYESGLFVFGNLNQLNVLDLNFSR